MLVFFCLLLLFFFRSSFFLFLGETKVDCKLSGKMHTHALDLKHAPRVSFKSRACAKINILPSHLSLRDHSRPTAKLLYEKNELSISYFCRRVCFGISCDRSSISHAINRSFYHAPVPWITGIPTTVTTEKGQTPDPCY